MKNLQEGIGCELCINAVPVVDDCIVVDENVCKLFLNKNSMLTVFYDIIMDADMARNIYAWFPI